MNRDFYKDKRFQNEHHLLEENMTNIQFVKKRMRNIVSSHNAFTDFMHQFSHKELRTKHTKLLNYNEDTKPTVKILDERDDWRNFQDFKNSSKIINPEGLLQKLQNEIIDRDNSQDEAKPLGISKKHKTKSRMYSHHYSRNSIQERSAK